MSTQTILRHIARAARSAAALLVVGATSCAIAPDDAAATDDTAQAVSACSTDWTVVATPNAGGQDNVLAAVAAASPNDVWAVGQFAPDANPNITLTLTEHFDGQSWSVVPSTNLGSNRGNALIAVAAAGGAAWAVGYHIGDDFLAHSLIEVWDGQTWRVSHPPQQFETENLYGVSASSPDDVWVVGAGRDDEGPFQAIALHFDGHAWSAVPPREPGVNGNVFYGVLARAPHDVWAVGQQIGTAPPDEALVEHWNGRRWSVVRAGHAAGNDSPSHQLLAVDLTAQDDLRAVGDAQDGVVSLRTFGIKGEGNSLAVQPTANPAVGDNRLTGVTAGSDRETFAVGSTLTEAGNLESLILAGGEHSTWNRVPSPSPGDGDTELAAIVRAGRHDLWAVGRFDGPDAKQTLALHRCR
jgi:hypothetical protein